MIDVNNNNVLYTSKERCIIIKIIHHHISHYLKYMFMYYTYMVMDFHVFIIELYSVLLYYFI